MKKNKKIKREPGHGASKVIQHGPILNKKPGFPGVEANARMQQDSEPLPRDCCLMQCSHYVQVGKRIIKAKMYLTRLFLRSCQVLRFYMPSNPRARKEI